MASENTNATHFGAELAVAVVAVFNNRLPFDRAKHHIMLPMTAEDNDIRTVLDALACLCVQRPKERIAIAINLSAKCIQILLTSSIQSLDIPETTHHLNDIWKAFRDFSQLYATLRRNRKSQAGNPRPLEVGVAEQVEELTQKLRSSIYARFQKKLLYIVRKRWNVYLDLVEYLRNTSPFLGEDATLDTLNRLTQHLESLISTGDNPATTSSLSIFAIVEEIAAIRKDKDFQKGVRVGEARSEVNQAAAIAEFDLDHYLYKITTSNALIKEIEAVAKKRSFRRVLGSGLPFTVELQIPKGQHDVRLPCSSAEWDVVSQLFLEQQCLHFFNPQEALQEVLDAYSGNGNIIQVRAHPELELVQYLHLAGLITTTKSAEKSSGIPTYIGTSTPPCASCYHYIRMRHACIQASSYEYTFPWYFPPGTTENDEERFLEYLQLDVARRMMHARIVTTGARSVQH